MMEGGASLAPRRWSLSAVAVEMPEQIGIFVHALDNGAEEQQELGVAPRGGTGLKQVFPGIRAEGPVIVLARAVDSGKGLGVQKDMPVRDDPQSSSSAPW